MCVARDGVLYVQKKKKDNSVSAVERGGQGVSYPGPRGKRGAPRSLRKNLFNNFSILTANVNPFHVSC